METITPIAITIKSIIISTGWYILNQLLNMVLYIYNLLKIYFIYAILTAMNVKLYNYYTGNILLDIIIHLNVPYNKIKQYVNFKKAFIYMDNIVGDMMINFDKDIIIYDNNEYSIIFNSIDYTIDNIINIMDDTDDLY